MSDLLASAFFVLALAATTAAADGPPPFEITTKRVDDRVNVKIEKGKATITVQSPFGISHAVIERAGETWPDAVVLRLHLKGLENFKMTNGKLKLGGSASVQAGKAVVRVWKDGKDDVPLNPKSPFWVDVRIIGGDGQPAREVPLKGGYFELPLPAALFDGNPKAVTVNWIDFYRN